MVEVDNNKEAEEEPSFSDPEDFEDDIRNEELIPEVLLQRPNIDQYEECCTVIFGLPIVNADRLPKLLNVVNKIIIAIDPTHDARGTNIPVNEDGGSKGCVFVQWKNRELAEAARDSLEGHRLDKNHVFSALLFKDLRKMDEPSEEWQAPNPAPYLDVGDLWWWMQHNRCRDQFAVQYEKNGTPTVGVYWHIKGHEPELAGDADKAERSNWTETMFKWSPHGSYLATIHARGVILWGGPEFARCRRFEHGNVMMIDFSPCENYIVTYTAPSGNWAYDEESLRIWDVRTGEMKKGFSLYALTNRNELRDWPFFKWSHDEKFFACLKAPEKDKLEKERKVDGIAVYSTDKFEMVDRRPLTIENIKTFQWSPTENVIAFFAECTDSIPAEFGLIQFPSRQKLRTARIHNVAEAQMFWQPSGKRLAVYTMRYSKKQMKAGEVKYIGGCTYHVEIFEIDKKDVSLMNLPLSEPFINFGWEHNGVKFSVLTGNPNKATPHVYKIDNRSPNPLKLMSKLDPGVQYNQVLWSPNGGWLAVLAKLSTGGNVMFVDTTLSEAKRSNVVEHPGFNKGYWDPTGRYFATCSTLGGRVGADLGYRLYTFQGRELCRKNLDRLSQFVWRPRPVVKLSDQKLKEIKNNLKKTAARFDREDNEEKYRASQEVVEKRRKVMSAFDLIRKRNLEAITNMRQDRIKLRGVDTDEDKSSEDLVEEQITIALSTEKTLAPIGEEED